MKLYFSPGACSLSPHIALLEASLAFTTERVDLRTKLTASGVDYAAINPKGYVPALELDDGSVLTEGPDIVQYIADQAPSKQLAPAPLSTTRRSSGSTSSLPSCTNISAPCSILRSATTSRRPPVPCSPNASATSPRSLKGANASSANVFRSLTAIFLRSPTGRRWCVST